MKKALWLLSLLVLTVSLTACGGSSSSSDTTTPTSGLSGAVAAAPVKDAKVMVDYKFLTEAAQKAATTQDAIVVGTTDKNGAIVFDAAAMAKVDRSKDVVLYSKDGVKFTSVYDTIKSVEDADKKATDLFNGSLRTVLAPEATTAYLTPANSIVADLVAKGSTLSAAEMTVRNMLVNTMGLIAMSDPLGNPLENITKSEFVSQAIFHVLKTSETAVSAGAVDFGALYSAEKANFAQLDAADITAITTALTTALKKDGFVVDADAIKADAAVSTKARTTALVVTNTSSSGLLVTLDTKKPYSYVIKEEDLNKSISFSVEGKTSKKDGAGVYVLESFEGAGKLQYNGLDAAVGTKFNTALSFTYVPKAAANDGQLTEAEKKAFTAISFKFVALDAAGTPVANVDPVTVEIKKVSPEEIIAKTFTAEIANKEFAIASGKKVIVGGDKTTQVDFKAALTLLNALDKDALKEARVRFTAPEGYVFTNVAGVDPSEASAKVSIMDFKFENSAKKDSFTSSDIIKQAELVKLGSTAVDHDVKEMTVSFMIGDKVVKSDKVTLGFAPEATDFDEIRNFVLKTSTDTQIADFANETVNLAGKIKATFSTWKMDIAAANAASGNATAADLPNPVKTFIIKAFDNTDNTVVSGASFSAAPKYMAASQTDEPTFVGGTATVTFNLGDKDGNGTNTAITLGSLTDKKVYTIRIAETGTEAEDMTSGGMVITAKAPIAVTVTAGTAPQAIALKTAVTNNQQGTLSTESKLVVTATIDAVDGAYPAAEDTDIAKNWVLVVAEGAVANTAIVPEIAGPNENDKYTLTFDINGKKLTPSSTDPGSIKVKRASVTVTNGYTFTAS